MSTITRAASSSATTDSTIAEFGRQSSTASAPSAVSDAEPTTVAPGTAAANASRASGEASYARTVTPASTRRDTIGVPMCPRPTKPDGPTGGPAHDRSLASASTPSATRNASRPAGAPQ